MSEQSWNMSRVYSRSVLLLEDDDQFASILQEFLELYSCKVTRVKDGVEGLRRIVTADFDLILCDMVMPTFPGDKFYIAVERVKPMLCKRFIFMTGHKDESLAQHRLNALNSDIELIARESRHHHVAQDQIKVGGYNPSQPFNPVFDPCHLARV